MTFATIRATEGIAAEVRYRMAQRLGVLVTASRIAGHQHIWLIQAA